MEKEELCGIRLKFGKTQKEMANLLGTSLKGIQSFEQGWRKIPVHIERQALFLLAVNGYNYSKKKPCWSTRKCSADIRRKCPAWEFQIGHLCWFVTGTICHGVVQKNWEEKMKVCRACEVFQSVMPEVKELPSKKTSGPRQ